MVGILGEDRITCVETERVDCPRFPFVCLFAGAAVLAVLCIGLLTSEALQVMARWTFDGDNRVGAVVGLALCAFVPLALLAWARYRTKRFARLIEKASPVAV